MHSTGIHGPFRGQLLFKGLKLLCVVKNCFVQYFIILEFLLSKVILLKISEKLFVIHTCIVTYIVPLNDQYADSQCCKISSLEINPFEDCKNVPVE